MSVPDKPGKLAQCIPIYGTILGQCTCNRANAGPIFLVCRVNSYNEYFKQIVHSQNIPHNSCSSLSIWLMDTYIK